jgi:hypothetical protein
MKNSKYILILTALIILSFPLLASKPSSRFEKAATELLKKDIIARADKVLFEQPLTITSFVCKRSAGGIHDFWGVVQNMEFTQPFHGSSESDPQSACSKSCNMV